MSQTNWEADKMLDVYIYDYLVKRKLQATAKAFQAEAKVSSDPVAIDAPGGFLFEWWSVFWDIFIARTNEKHSDAAASYIERFGENVGQVMDPNHASMLKSAATPGQPSGHILHGSAGGLSGPLQQVQARNQQLPVSAQDIKNEINQVLNPRAAGPDGSLIGVPGPTQAGNNLTLKGWPLTKIAQLQPQQQVSNQQQQLQQHALSSQQSQNSGHLLHQEKLGTASMAVDGSMPNSFRGTDQASNNQSGRKRKQPVSSSGPANSSGTANTAGPSPSSAPSTPSTHTPGDVMSMTQLQHNGSSSKPLIMFGDGTGALASPTNQLADMDRFVEDASLDDNVESFLSHDDADARDVVGRSMDAAKGFRFAEFITARASTNKVVCCHFSSDGKLLATGGHDKKALLWHADTLKQKSTLEEHTLLITDVRFSPSMPRLATSSFDKTVRVWDADNPGYSLRTFTGHSASVMSLDFHPSKEDLICSCDGDGEMRYWSINNGNCARVFTGGTTQMRFQPHHGRYIAAAAENTICVLDVETQVRRYLLQGHTKHVDSICWNPSGDILASVSEDSVRVWSLGSGNDSECVHLLSCNGNKFHSCVFHPNYPSFLVIGCYQASKAVLVLNALDSICTISLEIWDMKENKTMTLPAHDGLIAALAASNATGVIASASHDKCVKLWK
ncbi:hypothetical protein C4D60_Mb01t15200 [Musa balbisiana]|uniref:LisH domain-containing protein n=1 Tax=Musa balbisiana TaxID=52838 RepID=A0A4S8JPF1_MUSBA|nr:hypothetical protein C4D60_Mb01t15200 [Musa balbisiana]